MKNTFLIALLLCASSAFAQGTGPASVVKTNPFGYFAGQYQLGYERALTDNFSVQLQAGMIVGQGTMTLTDSSGTTDLFDISRGGFILIPEARYYPGGNACEGFYLAASGRYRVGKLDVDAENVYVRTALGGALTLGYQYTKDGMMVDFFVGPQFKTVDTVWGETFQSTTDEEEENSLFGDSSGTGVRVGVSVGFGF